MELGVEQNLATVPHYKGFLKNTGKILNITASPEIVYTADLIYLRQAYAMGLVRAAKDHIAGIRGAVGDLASKDASIKAALDLVLHASIRFFRLNRHHNVVYQGLGDSLRIFELNHKTVNNLDYFYRINFASALIVKTFSAALNPDKYLFLSSCCKVTLEGIARVRPFFAGLAAKPLDSMAAFLEVAEIFYRCMMIHIAIKLNIYEDKGIVKRTKDFKVNYVENRTLARELYRLVGELEKLPLNQADQFNVQANRNFAMAFIRHVAYEEAEQSIKNCEYLTEELKGVTCLPAQAIVDSYGIIGNFIENHLANSNDP